MDLIDYAIGLTLLMSVGIGLIHGLLITKAKLQPFVVTLCGLLIYRSLVSMVETSLGPVPLKVILALRIWSRF